MKCPQQKNRKKTVKAREKIEPPSLNEVEQVDRWTQL